MNELLKKAIHWTLYVIITFVIVITLLAVVIVMAAPTFFPEADISGFKDYVTTSSVILSFLSTGLGGFSIWQANSSGEQSAKILNGIRAIRMTQNAMSKDILKMSQNVKRTTTGAGVQWQPDYDES